MKVKALKHHMKSIIYILSKLLTRSRSPPASSSQHDVKGAIATGDPASLLATEKHATCPPGHWGTGKHRRPPGI